MRDPREEYLADTFAPTEHFGCAELVCLVDRETRVNSGYDGPAVSKSKGIALTIGGGSVVGALLGGLRRVCRARHSEAGSGRRAYRFFRPGLCRATLIA